MEKKRARFLLSPPRRVDRNGPEELGAPHVLALLLGRGVVEPGRGHLLGELLGLVGTLLAAALHKVKHYVARARTVHAQVHILIF